MTEPTNRPSHQQPRNGGGVLRVVSHDSMGPPLPADYSHGPRLPSAHFFLIISLKQCQFSCRPLLLITEIQLLGVIPPPSLARPI